jgi:hypothetical protein
VITLEKDGLRQSFILGDIRHIGSDVAGAIATRNVVVYSDPPWNPGNEKYWRTQAGLKPAKSYGEFLDAWCRVVSSCNPLHVFCEQSSSEKHNGMLLAAIERSGGWNLDLIEKWTVCYGSKSSVRPNVLFHFGGTGISTDPSGLRGEKMTRTVFEGLHIPVDSTIVDPCMGKGMTSRMAHIFGCHCVGAELNAARMNVAVSWLLKEGYREI